MSIFDASMKYKAEGTPLVVLAGKEYGSGSSRDWAAKGPYLLGIKAVIAESFERIHRSNLIGMGILAAAVRRRAKIARRSALTGEEVYEITGVAGGITPRMHATVQGESTPRPASRSEFKALRAHRHARRSRVLSPRRHPAIRPAAIAGEGLDG